MIELGELEAHYREFELRGVRIVVVSNDDRATAQATAKNFPHLIVVSDVDQKLAKTANVIHKGAGPVQDDTNAPTTILIDKRGVVRWLFRPSRFIERISPAAVVAAIDRYLKADESDGP